MMERPRYAECRAGKKTGEFKTCCNVLSNVFAVVMYAVFYV